MSLPDFVRSMRRKANAIPGQWWELSMVKWVAPPWKLVRRKFSLAFAEGLLHWSLEELAWTLGRANNAFPASPWWECHDMEVCNPSQMWFWHDIQWMQQRCCTSPTVTQLWQESRRGPAEHPGHQCWVSCGLHNPLQASHECCLRENHRRLMTWEENCAGCFGWEGTDADSGMG